MTGYYSPPAAWAETEPRPDWTPLSPDELSKARKQLADALAVHHHAQGKGCSDLATAYDVLAAAGHLMDGAQEPSSQFLRGRIAPEAGSEGD
jgi:hypothetical protein